MGRRGRGGGGESREREEKEGGKRKITFDQFEFMKTQDNI
jgi:hypothetical protein